MVSTRRSARVAAKTSSVASNDTKDTVKESKKSAKKSTTAAGRSTRRTKRKTATPATPVPKKAKITKKKAATTPAAAIPTPAAVVTPAAASSTPITPKQQAKKATAAAAAAVSPESASTTSTQKKKKGNRPVDPDVKEVGRNASAFTVVQNADGVWYDVVLNQCNITGNNNNNKYYRIQMLESNGFYYVWLKWGRVGESSTGRDLKGSFSSEASALPTFLKKYKDKTGNDFYAHEFKPKNKKYIPLDIDHDAEVSDEFKQNPNETSGSAVTTEVEYLPSELDPKTKDLIEVLFSKEMRDEILTTNFNLDPTRLPLGVPSEQQINIGLGILSRIEDKLNGNGVSESYATLSSQFYTSFPFSTGRRKPPTINNQTLLQERFDMCNVLLDMLSTNQTIRDLEQKVKPEKEKVPYPADTHYKSLNVDLKVVDPKSDVYKKIQTYFDKTKRGGQLLDVWQCNRAGEGERHEKKFQDIKERRLLWHGTNIAVVAPILTTGLRIMPHSGGRVGAGIYLASMQQKSAGYTSGYGSKYACMFLCEAALGKVHQITSDDWSIKNPPKGYDSIQAVGTIRPNKWVDVELDERKVQIGQGDEEQSGVDSRFYHDEFLVYDEAQIRLRYVLTVKLY